ncbi:MAG TPA: thioether cross-link-forming SCIFF peptide maturase [Clostridia bacterium]|nr:thioether cross-link-forming SCIFF peptide maturase [Clostridia bacterium]
MIHKYSLYGTNIVLDTASGAVHIVDDIAYNLIDENDTSLKDLEYLKQRYGAKYPVEEVEEAYKELKELCDNGLLYTKDEHRNIPGIELKNHVIKAMCLHVCHDCNLRCGYCFAHTGDFGGRRMLMDEETAKRAVDFLVRNSGARRNLEIDFFGGEPLMNMDVVKKTVEYIKENEDSWGKKINLTITTNGVLLDDENLEYINKYMDNLVLSIDGRKEINDKMRKTISGKGSYDVIIDNLKKAADSRNQDRYYVRGTFTSLNLDFSEDVKHLAEMGFKQISVEPVVAPDGSGYELKEEHLPILFKEYEKLAKYYAEKWQTDDWFNFFHFMIDLTQGPCVAKRVRGCGAGSEYVAVTPEGDIYPCHQFVGQTEFIIGNVYGNELDYELMDTFKEKNVFTKKSCMDCWARYYCSGGCHANSWNLNKDLDIPYELGCELQKKRIECAIWAKAME